MYLDVQDYVLLLRSTPGYSEYQSDLDTQSDK